MRCRHSLAVCSSLKSQTQTQARLLAVTCFIAVLQVPVPAAARIVKTWGVAVVLVTIAERALRFTLQFSFFTGASRVLFGLIACHKWRLCSLRLGDLCGGVIGTSSCNAS